MRLRPSRIQSQSILLSVVPLFFLLLLLALTTLLVNQTESTATWWERSSQVLLDSDALEHTVTDVNRKALEYTQRPSNALFRRYRSALRPIPAQERSLIGLLGDDPLRAVLARNYVALSNAVLAVIAQYVGDMRAHHEAKARAIGASPRTRQLVLAYQASKSKLDGAQRQDAIARFNVLRREVQQIGLALLAASLAGIALTVLITARFGLRIAQRMRQLAFNAHALEAGRPTAPLGGSDEIADLDKIYHAMTRRLQREHQVASTLQRALLPQQLPKVPGLRIETAYIPAAVGAEVGGDWYDVFSISESIVGLSVGDVAGHGLRAATLMGSLRQAMRMAARDDSDPATVLGRVNRVLCAEEEDMLSTAFFATLNLQDGTLRYSVAGHPPPIIVDPAGKPSLLDGEGFVLGAERRAEFPSFVTQMHVGSGLLLYTDGIVEIERDYFKGMNDLLDAVRAEYPLAQVHLPERLQQRLLSGTDPQDDSAILFIGVTELSPSRTQHFKRWTVDATQQTSAYRVKRALMWDLAELGAIEEDLPSVELILGELLSNVARHTPGEAEVTLESKDGVAVLRVCDKGTPFAAETRQFPDVFAESGRGLFLVRALAREVEIERRGGGNCVSAVLPIALAS